jgi:hypothetical protein
MLEKLITEKTAKDIISALVSDQNNIDIETFKSVYEIAKPYLGKSFMAVLFANIKKSEYINFFSPPIKIDMLNIFEQSKDLFLKKYPPFPSNQLILTSVFESKLPESFKKDYFHHFFYKINHADNNLIPIVKKVYIKYEFKITDSNHALYNLISNSHNGSMINTVVDLFEHPHFVANVKEFNALERIKILMNLTKNKHITLEKFKEVINKSCFENLLVSNFPIGSFEINEKTFFMYKYFNIDVKEQLKKEGVESFIHLKNKGKKFILSRLQDNTQLFTEQEALSVNGKIKDTIDGETWSSLKHLIDYKNKDITDNENFLYLTQKSFSKPNKSITEFLILLEKQIFEEKLENAPTRNKLKI